MLPFCLPGKITAYESELLLILPQRCHNSLNTPAFHPLDGLYSDNGVNFNRVPPSFLGFRGGSAVKESTCNLGDLNSIPELERSSGKGKGYPLQYSGLENSTDCIVHGIAKSQTQLNDFHFHFPSYLPSLLSFPLPSFPLSFICLLKNMQALASLIAQLVKNPPVMQEMLV